MLISSNYFKNRHVLQTFKYRPVKRLWRWLQDNFMVTSRRWLPIAPNLVSLPFRLRT